MQQLWSTSPSKTTVRRTDPLLSSFISQAPYKIISFLALQKTSDNHVVLLVNYLLSLAVVIMISMSYDDILMKGTWSRSLLLRVTYRQMNNFMFHLNWTTIAEKLLLWSSKPQSSLPNTPWKHYCFPQQSLEKQSLLPHSNKTPTVYPESLDKSIAPHIQKSSTEIAPSIMLFSRAIFMPNEANPFTKCANLLHIKRVI